MDWLKKIMHIAYESLKSMAGMYGIVSVVSIFFGLNQQVNQFIISNPVFSIYAYVVCVFYRLMVYDAGRILSKNRQKNRSKHSKSKLEKNKRS